MFNSFIDIVENCDLHLRDFVIVRNLSPHYKKELIFLKESGFVIKDLDFGIWPHYYYLSQPCASSKVVTPRQVGLSWALYENSGHFGTHAPN